MLTPPPPLNSDIPPESATRYVSEIDVAS